jgi:hypothetical protein
MTPLSNASKTKHTNGRTKSAYCRQVQQERMVDLECESRTVRQLRFATTPTNTDSTCTQLKDSQTGSAWTRVSEGRTSNITAAASGVSGRFFSKRHRASCESTCFLTPRIPKAPGTFEIRSQTLGSRCGNSRDGDQTQSLGCRNSASPAAKHHKHKHCCEACPHTNGECETTYRVPAGKQSVHWVLRTPINVSKPLLKLRMIRWSSTQQERDACSLNVVRFVNTRQATEKSA